MRCVDDEPEASDGSDVIAVLGGHFHAQLYDRMGGAAIWVTPRIVTRVARRRWWSPSYVRA